MPNIAETIVLERPLLSTNSTLFPAIGHLKRQRIYIFLTWHGVIFIVMLLVMLLAAVNYNNSMAYMLTFLLSSLFMVSMLHTYKNLRGLIFSTPVANSVFAKDTAYFPILIDNRSGPIRVALELCSCLNRNEKKQGDNIDTEALPVNISVNELKRVYFSMPATERGYLKLGRLRISSSYPFGLFYTWSYFDTHQHCIVYPQALGNPLLPISTEQKADEQTGAGIGTDDFVGHRQYRHGDSMRSIDWKVLAREQGLLVKRFNGGNTDKLLIQWDQCAHMLDVEKRLSQLCLWILEAEKHGSQYSLEIPGTFIELGYGDAHKHQCLKALATYGLTNNT